MNLTEFRTDFAKIERCCLTCSELENKLSRYLLCHEDDLPAFLDGHFVKKKYLPDNRRRYIYQDIQYGDAINYPMDKRIETYIVPEECVGTTWLYYNDPAEKRPFTDRLARCLSMPVETAPPILVTQIGKYFMCNDGNHRIYAAYLLNHAVKILIMGRNVEIT